MLTTTLWLKQLLPLTFPKQDVSILFLSYSFGEFVRLLQAGSSDFIVHLFYLEADLRKDLGLNRLEHVLNALTEVIWLVC